MQDEAIKLGQAKEVGPITSGDPLGDTVARLCSFRVLRSTPHVTSSRLTRHILLHGTEHHDLIDRCIVGGVNVHGNLPPTDGMRVVNWVSLRLRER
jgi:hypothetical protein